MSDNDTADDLREQLDDLKQEFDRLEKEVHARRGLVDRFLYWLT